MSAVNPSREARPRMRNALVTAIALAVAAALPAAASAEPRFALLASDGTGYAVEASESAGQPVTFTLSDDSGVAPVESRLPRDSEGKALRVAASARCLPGGTRLLRVYGTTERKIRRVVVTTEGGARSRVKLVKAPRDWSFRGRVMGRVLEIRDRALRLVATDKRRKEIAAVRIAFAQTCSTEGTKALGATLVPARANPDTTEMTARLTLPARSSDTSYTVNFVQPPWAAGSRAFGGSPWGSPLGPDGDASLDGPGSIEGAAPALSLVGSVCLRGFAQQANTVIVRVPAGQATTLLWPLAIAPEPLWDSTRLEAAFRVRRSGFGSVVGSNTVPYDGARGIEFDVRIRRRGRTAVAKGTTSSPLANRRVTVYVLQSRPRPDGVQLIENDFRPYKTLRVRTDSRGRFTARFGVTDRAYRVVADATDTPADRVDDTSCPFERDYR